MARHVSHAGFVANSKYKIQALFKDFQGPKLQAPKLSTKSHILDADIQNLDCNVSVTLKCTVRTVRTLIK